MGDITDLHSDRGDACGRVRELISAEADDAATPAEVVTVDAHVATCQACTEYRNTVAAMARSIRLRQVGVDREFVESVMARTTPGRLGRGAWMRPALAWCGLVVAVQSVSPLVLGEIDGAPVHIARHVGASMLALAIGLLFVAWKPHRAAGLLPYVGALFAATGIAALADVVSGDRSAFSEIVHLSELVGMLLVWMIAGSPGWDRVERAIHPFKSRRATAHSTS